MFNKYQIPINIKLLTLYNICLNCYTFKNNQLNNRLIFFLARRMFDACLHEVHIFRIPSSMLKFWPILKERNYAVRHFFKYMSKHNFLKYASILIIYFLLDRFRPNCGPLVKSFNFRLSKFICRFDFFLGL